MAPSTPAVGTLSGISLFRGVSTRKLERLAPLMHERIFPVGTNILTAGQPGETVYVLLRGSVKVHLFTANGTEVILAVLGPGELLGEMSAADSLGRSADVVTLEVTTFLWIDRRTFRSSVEESSVLALNLAEILSKRVRLTNARLLSMATLDVPGRVAAQVTTLAREYGEEIQEGVRIPIRLTQSDLAALVGASRVRVNQALGFFRKRGLISIDRGGHVIVHDQDALAQRAR